MSDTTGRHWFGGTGFDDSFLFATTPDGRELRFTRAERAVLTALAANPRRVMSRDRLLDAVSGTGSDAVDRNIDFVINRLRGKLGDKARAPRFIATQYGEGYVWIAAPDAAETAATTSAEPLLHIGPVFGLERIASPAGQALLLALLAALHGRLVAGVGTEQTVTLAPAERLKEPAPAGARFTLEASFYAAGAATPVHAALVLREGRTGRIVRALRQVLVDPQAAADELAPLLRKAMWERMSFKAGEPAAPTDVPMELRLHDTSRLLTREPESWFETEAQTAQALAERPDDPEAALAAGMSLYSRLLFSPYSPHAEPGATARMEDEIERLVLSSLPRIGEDLMLALAAAKLLLFVGRDYHELAEQLAEDAFTRSTAFAPAFSTLGQIRMCQGQLAEALDLYEHGIELAEPGSQFHIYLLSLACVAHLASGDADAVRRACARVFAVQPEAEFRLGPFVMPKNEVNSPIIAGILAQLTPERSVASLRYSYYVSARLFREEAHRENLLRDLVEVCVARFGAAVVPEEVARCAPRLGTAGAPT